MDLSKHLTPDLMTSVARHVFTSSLQLDVSDGLFRSIKLYVVITKHINFPIIKRK